MTLDIFSFSGRIGRLSYFLTCLGIGAAFGGITALVAVLTFAGGNKPMALLFFGICMLFVMPLMIWTSLALQARRIRDIGWNPIYVIIGSWIVMIADRVAAHVAPAVSIGGHGHQTWVGTLTSISLTLALLFWPSADDEQPTKPGRTSTIAMPPRNAMPSTAAVIYGRPGAPQKLFGPR